MQIIDLKPNQKNIEITLEVLEKDTPRTFTRYGRKGRVCKAICKDQTGYITLTLWDDQIDKIEEGQCITLTHADVTSWRGEMQISISGRGRIKHIDTELIDIRCKTGVPDILKDKIIGNLTNIQLALEKQKKDIAGYCTRDMLGNAIAETSAGIIKNLIEIDNALLEYGFNSSVSGR